MDGVLVSMLVFVGVLVVVLGVLLVRDRTVARWQRHGEERDETVRAGRAAEDDPDAAARRAQGSSSWMRPDGGGA
jgi:hypothetical protein